MANEMVVVHELPDSSRLLLSVWRLQGESVSRIDDVLMEQFIARHVQKKESNGRLTGRLNSQSNRGLQRLRIWYDSFARDTALAKFVAYDCNGWLPKISDEFSRFCIVVEIVESFKVRKDEVVEFKAIFIEIRESLRAYVLNKYPTRQDIIDKIDELFMHVSINDKTYDERLTEKAHQLLSTNLDAWKNTLVQNQEKLYEFKNYNGVLKERSTAEFENLPECERAYIQLEKVRKDEEKQREVSFGAQMFMHQTHVEEQPKSISRSELPEVTPQLTRRCPHVRSDKGVRWVFGNGAVNQKWCLLLCRECDGEVREFFEKRKREGAS